LPWYLGEPGHVGRWEIDPALDLAAGPAKPTRESVPLKVA